MDKSSQRGNVDCNNQILDLIFTYLHSSITQSHQMSPGTTRDTSSNTLHFGRNNPLTENVVGVFTT